MQSNLQTVSFSIINLSRAQVDRRLDPEYYDPIYLSKIETLVKKKAQTIIDIYDVRVFSGPFGSFFKSESYLSKGHPFVRISDIKDIFLDKKQMVFVSDDDFAKLKKYQLSLGDIIFSKIGTVGRLSVITEEIGAVAISENNIGLAFSTKMSETDKAYIAFFLLSDFGQKQIFRMASGNVQLKLNVSDIENVLMPKASEVLKNKLRDTLDTLHTKLLLSKEKYKEAERLLLADLNLADYSPSDVNTSTRNLSDCLAEDRFDAEFWMPKYDEIIRRMSIRPLHKLKEVAEAETGQYIAEYTEDNVGGKPFIRGTNISHFEIHEEELLYVLPETQKQKHIAKKNDVVVTRVGSIGLCARIQDNLIGATISDNLIAIRIKQAVKLNSYYLTVYLNSFVGQELMNKFSRGSVQQRLNQETLKELPIPKVDVRLQEEIASILMEANSQKRQSQVLLEKAKRAVEIFIEQDEASALAYLN